MNLASIMGEVSLGQWLAVATMALGLLAVAWAIRRSSRARAESDRMAALPAGERLEAIRRREEERRALEAVASDAEELGRQLAADLDTRAERLERLIVEADRRIRRLEAVGGAGAADGVRARAAAPGAYVEAGPGPAARPAMLDDTLDPLSRQIYALADQGLKPVEIAGRLEQHTGKVELILALRPR